MMMNAFFKFFKVFLKKKFGKKSMSIFKWSLICKFQKLTNQPPTYKKEFI